MRFNQLPDTSKLNEIFVYDPETGFLSKHKKRKNRVAIGCCSLDSGGYFQASVDGKLYAAHRIIWAIVTGTCSPDMEIDHINMVRTDNRIDNLRLATRSQNSANSLGRSALGIKGVYRDRHRFIAQITKDRKVTYLGTFSTVAEAKAAYDAAASLAHGKFWRPA